MLFVTRLVASLGVVALAARRRMWLYALVGLALLVIEPWAVLAALPHGAAPGLRACCVPIC
jgi:hypothetical protein